MIRIFHKHNVINACVKLPTNISVSFMHFSRSNQYNSIPEVFNFSLKTQY